jgi:acyl dehydratase
VGVSSRYILRQGPALGALGLTAIRAVQQRWGHRQPTATPLPGRTHQRRVKALPRALIDAYIQHVGGDPKAYRGELPPHLFPQWCLPTLARTLEQTDYPLLRIVNAGCRVQWRGVIPDKQTLVVRAQLQDVDDNGRRAVLHQNVRTGPERGEPEALVIDFYASVPLGTGKRRDAKNDGKTRADATPPQAGTAAAAGDGNGAQVKRERPRVAFEAREIARIRLGRDAGLGYAKLTGDFNPIHWLPAYARASGFPNVILHGFGTLAHAWEGLNRRLFGGDVHAIASFDAKFTRPLVLPHEVGLYVLGHEVFVGDAPGGPAYLIGTYSTRGDLWAT